MRTLLLLITLLITCNLFAQKKVKYDTTAVPDTLIEYKEINVEKTAFFVYDTSDYEPGNDSLTWYASGWNNDSVNGDTIFYEQLRINDVGIREVRYWKKLIVNDTSVVHSYDSKVKEKKDKDKNK